MPTYRYKGVSRAGADAKGVLEADTPAQARKKLHAEGVFPLTLAEGAEGRKGSVFPSLLGQSDFLPLLTRQLATLVGAGVPLVAALQSVASQIDDPQCRKVLLDVQESVRGGAPLARAVEARPSVFPELYASMVRAGEESGTLGLALSRLADHLEEHARTRNRVRSALAYPLLMAVVAALVVVFLLTFVVPKIVGIFSHLGQALPLPTRVLIAVTDALAAGWWAILLFAGGATLLARRRLATERGKRSLDAFLLKLPLVGRLAHLSALSRFARTLSTLVSGGIPVDRALRIVAPVVGNVVMGDSVVAAADRVVEGATLSDALRAHAEIPQTLIQMVAVGEESGTLGNMLDRAADAMDEETEARLSRLLSLLEPAIILAMGTVVAFIVVSILLPLLDISRIVR
ncbi:MAG: type II secretion system protein GspF [Deltaproteobacteria bacterium]|nr:MAG: type II secretion system protein GspF [Deltaproteobacteria bacterium]